MSGILSPSMSANRAPWDSENTTPPMFVPAVEKSCAIDIVTDERARHRVLLQPASPGECR
jgi:hypothetical protein